MPRLAFGGLQISFKGRTETVEEVFGTKDVTPAQMTKLLWEYVKTHALRTDTPQSLRQVP